MGANTFKEYARLAGYEFPKAGSITAPVYIPGSIVDVTAHGAVGDGVTDDSAAFQRAVDALVNTGGVIWVPPDKIYALGSKVTIKSKYSIWIKSSMTGHIASGTLDGTTYGDKGIIKPLNNLDYLFEWTRPDGLKWHEGGGGGVEGLCFTDWIMTPAGGRNKTIDGAIRVHTTKWFCYDCNYEFLKGRAIGFGTTIYSQLRNVKVFNCGDTGKPPIDIDGGGTAEKVWQVDDSANAFVDETADFNSAATADLQPFPAAEAVGDYFAIGAPDSFLSLTFGNTGGTPGGGGGVVAWEYWNGSAWTALAGVVDGTTSFTATGNRQRVTFTAPSDWAKRSLNGSISLYYARARVTTVYTTNPVYNQGWVNSNGFVWCDRAFLEANQYGNEQVVRVNDDCLLTVDGVWFENGAAATNPFIDATEGGQLDVANCQFKGTAATSIIVGGTLSRIKDSLFDNAPGANHTIDVLAAAHKCLFSGLHITKTGAGRNLSIASNWNTATGIYCSGGGGILISGNSNLLSGIQVYAPGGAAGTYAIDFTGFYNVLSGAVVEGAATSVSDAIRTSDSVINGVLVRNFAGSARGIVVNNFAQISGTKVTEMPGDDYVYTYCSWTFNQGTVRAGTAASGAVTINAEAGLVTTESLTTAAGSDYTLTMTNAALGPAANTQLMVTVLNGGNTAGEPHLWTITHAAGSATIVIRNTGSAAFNGTLKIQFQVVNLGALA